MGFMKKALVPHSTSRAIRAGMVFWRFTPPAPRQDVWAAPSAPIKRRKWLMGFWPRTLPGAAFPVT